MIRNPVARMLRHARHLKTGQAWAQLRYQLIASGPPVELTSFPRLVAESPEVPFLPAPAHARFDGRDRFELLNREVRFPQSIDWETDDEGLLWTYHLHQFDYARRTDLSAEARAAVVLDWIARHPRGVGWAPHPTSLRVFSWGKLLLTPGALRLGSEGVARVERSLAQQIETLAGRLEHRLQANHLLSNLLAVVWGGVLFAEGPADAWLRGVSMLRRELASQIHADGAHEERSPMYHALLLESVLDLINAARSAPGRAPSGLVEDLESCAARMLGALEIFTHPDGEIALFSDSAFGIAHPLAALRAYAAALGVAGRGPDVAGVLADGGFVRLEAGPFSLLASVGGPAPPHQPGHAHCDALAFELCVRGQRVVTDTGVCEYRPGPLRDASRTTRAHATLEVGGEEQAEIWAAHRVGGRPRVALERVEPGSRLEARCAGWATRDSVHRRVIEVSEDRVELRDTLEGKLRPVRFALPLAPGLTPRVIEASGERSARVELGLRGREELHIELPAEVRWRVEETPYFPEFGRRLDRACILGRADAFRLGSWRFELVR